jgi:serine/threonine-protein kinase
VLPTRTELTPEAFLAEQGAVFAVFDQQDSGNLSYGAQIDGRRLFVKALGPRTTILSVADRIALLRNAVELATISHAALVSLRHVVESPAGPILFYDWIEGELLGVERARRSDPTSPWGRFRALPPATILAALDVILDLHRVLAAAGWVAVDFYDGALLYDFATGALHVIDLDHYHRGPFTNEMGRMFGSTRFMAPEEFQRGARIDERTTVFTLGRTILELLSYDTAFRGPPAVLAVAAAACQADPAQRFPTVAALCQAWTQAREQP